MLCAVVGIAVIGSISLLISRAATPDQSLEAEDGIVSDGATVGIDPTASGGKFITFGAGSAGADQTTASTGQSFAIRPDSMGLNGADVKFRINAWNDSAFKPALVGTAPKLLRYAGGTSSDEWRWRRIADGDGHSANNGGGFTADGAIVSAGVPATLGLDRWKELTEATGAGTIVDLNIFTDARIKKQMTVTPYAGPYKPEQMALLQQMKKDGIKVVAIEMGNEFNLGAGNPYGKNIYSFPRSADSSKLHPVTGLPIDTTKPANDPSGTGLPLGWVGNAYAPIGNGHDTGGLNVNGQDEMALMWGKAMSGRPEVPWLPPGSGAAGGAYAYGKLIADWGPSAQTIWPGVPILVSTSGLGRGDDPLGTSPGSREGRYVNRGLIEGLKDGNFWPQGVVLHAYTDAYYIPPMPLREDAQLSSYVMSADTSKPTFNRKTLDYSLSGPAMKWNALRQMSQGLRPDSDTIGTSGWYQNSRELYEHGAKVWITEWGFNHNETPVGNTAALFDSVVGSAVTLLHNVAMGLIARSDPKVEVMTMHSTVGGSASFAALWSSATPFKTQQKLNSYGHFKRTVTDIADTAGSDRITSDSANFITDRTIAGSTDQGSKITINKVIWDATVVDEKTVSLSRLNGTTTIKYAGIGAKNLSGTIDRNTTLPLYLFPGAHWPDNPGPTVPVLSRSAAGQAAMLLNRTFGGASTYTPLNFSGNLVINPTAADPSATTPGIVGGVATNTTGKRSALIINLRDKAVSVTLPDNMAGDDYITITTDNPGKPLYQESDYRLRGGTIPSDKTVIIPPYGALRSDAQTDYTTLASQLKP